MTEIIHSPDPDKLPHINIAERRSKLAGEGDWTDFATTKSVIAAFAVRHQNEIQESMRSLEGDPFKGSHIDDSTIVAVPIGLETENIDDLEPTFRSIGKAADQLDAPTIVLPWLNYSADQRRETDKIQHMTAKADLARGAILATLEGHNTRTITGVDQLPHGSTISSVRQRKYLAALGYSQRHFSDREGKRLPNIYDIPFVSVDADTTISEGALVTVRNSLASRRSLFVNGNLSYVGGVMERSREELQKSDIGAQMLYISEHMRRLMFNHLPPQERRGYLPETGLGTYVGTIASLGGYNTYAKDNESYWLEMNAVKALDDHFDLERRRKMRPVSRGLETSNRRPAGEPFISHGIGQQLESITRYENYEVETSISGVEALVRRFGVAALIGFDQGNHYTMRTNGHEHWQDNVLDDRELSISQIRELMNGMYSYYKDCGGELTADGLIAINRLVLALVEPSTQDLTPGMPAWLPAYVDKDERPRVNA